jgi:hypothetical protein
VEYSRDHRICSLRTGFRLIQVPLKTGFTVLMFQIVACFGHILAAA